MARELESGRDPALSPPPPSRIRNEKNLLRICVVVLLSLFLFSEGGETRRLQFDSWINTMSGKNMAETSTGNQMLITPVVHNQNVENDVAGDNHPLTIPHPPTLQHDNSNALAPRKEKYAYVVAMFLGTKYLCGAAMLAWNLRDRDPSIDLVAVVAGHLSQDQAKNKHAIQYLKDLGYKIVLKPILMNPWDTKRRFNYCKVNVHSLIEYTKVVFIDSDIFLPNGAKRMDKLFELYEGAPKPVAIGMSRINSGVFLVRPNMTNYLDMLSQFSIIKSRNGGDQDFQHEFFKRYRQGFDGFHSRHLILKENRSKKYKRIWMRNETDPNIDVYHHYNTKIWLCPRDVYCASEKGKASLYIWPQMIDAWWAQFDDMQSAWPVVVENGNKDYCITNSVNKNDAGYTIPRSQVWEKIRQRQGRTIE